MGLESGQSLAHYRVTSRIGAGGMGEVYRATDENLGRDVAIKVLPEAVAKDAERLARFKREAQLLASLNHPHIAAIHGLEESEGKPFLVLELVEGEDLAERLKRGPIPVDEALRVALQMAEGIEAAHEKGIVHRDLKPANVTLTPEGDVKVLDFGLAKAYAGDAAPGSSPDRSQSPTLAHSGTQAGVILGTAAYMSPEQARGKAVDKRADVWGFGVVLFEMLTGKQLFAGETVSDTLAAVLTREPDLGSLPRATPAGVTALLRRCLVRDPRNRLQSIGDARIALQEAMAGDAPREPIPPSGPPARAWGAVHLAPWLLALGLAVALVLSRGTATGPPPPTVLTAAIPAPTDAAFDIHVLAPANAVLSPDGSKIAFGAKEKDGGTRLFVRDLVDGRVVRFTGTEEVQYPFWSPDGRWLGFFTQVDGTLKKVPASGGAPLTLCRAANGKGGTWSVGDVILFSPSSGSPIHRVAAAGGESTPVTQIDSARHNSHRHPRFLPDGRHFLYLARSARPQDSSLMLGSLDGGPARELMRSATQAEYVPGHLLFVRESILMAQPFDAEAGRTTGDAEPVAEGVIETAGAALAMFSASRAALVFHAGEIEAALPLEWRDRAGVRQGTLGEPGIYRDPAFSPDGRRLAVARSSVATANPDLWLLDLDGGAATRFTLDPGEEAYPVWMPDGRALVFGSNASGPHHLYRKAVGGVGEAEVLYAAPGSQWPTGVSPDGRWLIFMGVEQDRVSVGVLDLETRQARPLRAASFNDGDARVSPDGHWLLYDSDESGRAETYVTPFPGPGRSWQVSAGGGRHGFWRQDSREIVYTDLTGMVVAVPVSTSGDAFRVGQPVTLFRTAAPTPDLRALAMAPDGQRFLVVQTGVREARNELRIVVNWPSRLGSRALAVTAR